MSDPFAGLSIPVDEAARLELMNPKSNTVLRDLDGKACYVDLLSADSPVAKDHERRVSARLTSSRRSGRGYPPEEMEADGVELLARLTTGWYLVNFDGLPLDIKFSLENARLFYAQPGMQWARRQVNSFVADVANFVKASSTTS